LDFQAQFYHQFVWGQNPIKLPDESWGLVGCTCLRLGLGLVSFTPPPRLAGETRRLRC
jgi:hypothetical protein